VSIYSDNFMTVAVPAGAKTGQVTVQGLNGNLSTLYNFTIVCTGPLCLRHLRWLNPAGTERARAIDEGQPGASAFPTKEYAARKAAISL
jgi:hypothetical protein